MRTSTVTLLTVWAVAFSVEGLCVSNHAQAGPINLNDFFADPTVTVAVDGSSAVIAEDPLLSPVLLSNDPGLDDPEVIFAGPLTFLSFDFSFSEALGENDEFGAFVLDSNGFNAGPGFEFFTQDTSSGTVAFDLSGLTAEPFVGLQFQLSSLVGDTRFDSELTISNVQTTVIPEPSTLILVALGGLGLIGYGSRRRKQGVV